MENKKNLLSKSDGYLSCVNKGLAHMSSIDDLSAARARLGSTLTAARVAKVAEADLKEGDMRRRKLHNAIEDIL